MTGRHGELAGHLFSNVDEFGAATLNALRQTISLARAGKLAYAIIPSEAEATLNASGAELVPAGDLCLASHHLAAEDVRLICLLPAGHLPTRSPTTQHGYGRFLDARRRGEAQVDAAVSRIEARAAAGRALRDQ